MQISDKSPYEVVVKGIDKVIGYACFKCCRFHSPTIYLAKPEDANEAAKQAAIRCCEVNVCKLCGNRITNKKERFWKVCYSCRPKVNPENTEILNSLPENYDAMLYYNGTYYSDMDDILDVFEYEDLPESVYLTIEVVWEGLKLFDALESSLEEFSHADDGCYDPMDQLVGLEELQEAVKIFNEKNEKTVRMYFQDDKKAVKVPKLNALEEAT